MGKRENLFEHQNSLERSDFSYQILSLFTRGQNKISIHEAGFNSSNAKKQFKQLKIKSIICKPDDVITKKVQDDFEIGSDE